MAEYINYADRTAIPEDDPIFLAKGEYVLDTPKPSPPPHLHERIFGFRDPVYGPYMNRKKARVPVAFLKESSNALGQNLHPVAQYAAGAAAMELALHHGLCEGAAPARSFEKRAAWLQVAEERWTQALEGFPEARNNIQLPKPAHQLFRIEQQTKRSLAYLPLTELAAGLVAGVQLSLEEVQKGREATGSATAHLAEFLLNLPHNERSAGISRAGLISEAACGIVGQCDEPAKYLLIPASFRQDHHPELASRADLLAIPTEPPYRKTLIQVRSSFARQKPGSYGRLVVDASRDLALVPGKATGATLRGFIDTTEGIATPETEHRLAVIGRVMTMRLDAFEASRNPQT